MLSTNSQRVFNAFEVLAEEPVNPNIRSLRVVVISGVMDCGKTTTAWKAMEHVSNKFPDKKYIQCYVRLDSLLESRPNLANEDDQDVVLAVALLNNFSKGGLRSND